MLTTDIRPTGLYKVSEVARLLRLDRHRVKAMIVAGSLRGVVPVPDTPVRVPGWSVLDVLGLWESPEAHPPCPPSKGEERFPPPEGVDPIEWFGSGEYWELRYDAGDCPEPLQWIAKRRKERRAAGLPNLAVKRRPRPIGRVG